MLRNSNKQINNIIPGFWYLKKKEVNKKYQKKKYKMFPFKKFYEVNNFTNFNKVEKIYKNLLIELTFNLNKIHDLNWKQSSWEIIIGPWLRRFSVTIYDRVLTTKFNLKKKNNFYFVNSKSSSHLNSYDVNDFFEKITEDKWNEEIFKRLYRYFLSRNDKFLKKSKIIPREKILKSKLFFYKIKILNIILKIYKKIFCGNSKIVFSRTYFGKRNFFFNLLFKIGEFPNVYLLNNEKMNLSYSKKLRGKILFKPSSNEKEKIAKVLIKECIPKVYLEGFKLIQDKIDESNLPKEKCIIFTSNLRNDSIFKFWVARQKNIGSRLIMAQHGSGFNMFKFHDQFSYEGKIADKFLTWGWNLKKNKNIVPFNILNQKIKKTDFEKKEKISISLENYDKYLSAFTYRDIMNLSESEKILNYRGLQEIQNFCEHLDVKIKKNLVVRPHPSNSRRNSIEKFEKKFLGKLKFEHNPSISGEKFLRNFNLNIFHDIQSTSFAFSMALNIPSLLINPFHLSYYTVDLQKKIAELQEPKNIHRK